MVTTIPPIVMMTSVILFEEVDMNDNNLFLSSPW